MHLILSLKLDRRQGLHRINGHPSLLAFLSARLVFTRRLMQINVHSSIKRKRVTERKQFISRPTRTDGNKMHLSHTQIAWWMAVVSNAPDDLFAEEKSVDP